jgi:hypothetical protein
VGNETMLTLYEFLKQTNQIPDLVAAFKKYMVEKCSKILGGQQSTNETITQMVELKNHGEEI